MVIYVWEHIIPHIYVLMCGPHPSLQIDGWGPPIIMCILTFTSHRDYGWHHPLSPNQWVETTHHHPQPQLHIPYVIGVVGC